MSMKFAGAGREAVRSGSNGGCAAFDTAEAGDTVIDGAGLDDPSADVDIDIEARARLDVDLS